MDENIEKKHILYIASTYEHLKMFHIPYIDKLKEYFIVDTLANGKESTININFKKKFFSLYNIYLIIKLHNFFNKHCYDVLILNTSLAAFICRMALKGIKSKPKVINIVHGYLFSDKKSLKNNFLLFLEKLVKNQTDYILTMNQTDYKIAKDNCLCIKDTFKIDGMGVKHMQISSEKNPYHDSMYNILYAAEYSDRKNQIELIKTIPQLIDAIPNIHLTLLGKGKNYKLYRKYICKHNLAQYITLEPYSSNPINYYKYCNLYVSSSKSEGLPFNIVNACEYGKPIIASNIKGHRDIYENGKSLLIYLNQDELIDKIKKVYRNEYAVYSESIFKFYSFERVFDYNVSLLFKIIMEGNNGNSKLKKESQ